MWLTAVSAVITRIGHCPYLNRCEYVWSDTMAPFELELDIPEAGRKGTSYPTSHHLVWREWCMHSPITTACPSRAIQRKSGKNDSNGQVTWVRVLLSLHQSNPLHTSSRQHTSEACRFAVAWSTTSAGSIVCDNKSICRCSPGNWHATRRWPSGRLEFALGCSRS